MVTNPGETQMVSFPGRPTRWADRGRFPIGNDEGHVKRRSRGSGNGGVHGGLSERQNSRRTEHKPPQPVPPRRKVSPAVVLFPAVVAQMGLTTGESSTGTQPAALQWSSDAQERLDKLPSFVQPMVKGSVETYARKNGYTTVTLQVMDDSKNSSNGMTWSPEAEERLSNIPDFIQPMARKEIERLAKERGATTVSAELMDEAKGKVQ